MPNEQRESLDRRDFMMAAIGLVGASATLASSTDTANAQDTKAPAVGPADGSRFRAIAHLSRFATKMGHPDSDQGHPARMIA